MKGIKLLGVAVASSAAALVAISPVSASSAHFTVGPTFTDNGLSLSAAGTLAGLGGDTYSATLSATGIPDTTCTSPGGNSSPGQNPKPVTAIGEGPLAPAGTNHNGTYTVSVTTESATAPATAKAAGCPNNNWSASLNDVTWTSATITVVDTSTGKTVFSHTYTSGLN